MKRLIFALSAVALMGLASACVDQIETNPNFDPVKNTVNTQFVLNIAPADTDPQTKQSSSAVQMNSTFRGLNNASLLTFSLQDGEGNLTDGKKVIKTSINDSYRHPTSYIDLSYALTNDAINPWGTGIGQDGSGTPLSRRIVQIDLPTGTNALVFYGQAVTGSSDDLKNDFGVLGYNKEGLTDLDMTKIGCWATPRLEIESDEATDYHRIEDIIEAVYNNLFKRQHSYTSSYGDYNMSGITVKWSDYESAYDFTEKRAANSPIPGLINDKNGYTSDNALPPVQAAPFEVTLAKAYHAFTSMNPAEFRAGSGKGVLRQMSDLYTIMTDTYKSTPTNSQEQIARYIVNDIISYLTWFFKTGGENSRVLTSWQPISGDDGVINALSTHLNITLTAPSNSKYTLDAFPLHFDLPIGASTMMQYGDNPPEGHYKGEFYYNSHNIPLPAMGGQGQTMSVHDYTYPPSLVYFGNAPIRVSNSNTLTSKDFQDGTANWENDVLWTGSWLSGTGTVNGFSHVTSSTRGVAMAYNIQYANALLETKVKYAAGVVGTNGTGLEDNNMRLNGDPNQVFHPSATSGLQLTGVLVGGQPDLVGWTYLATPETNFDKMVYDKRINSVDGTIDQNGGSTYYLSIPEDGSATTPNYTTLFDNYDPQNKGANARVVYVALEFRNNLGDDFWANYNMVRQGGEFYLIGKLALTADQISGFKWTGSDSKVSKIMPPYADDGSTQQEVRIFMQDFITDCTFTITKDALQKAYVTVPDLRSSSLSLGLSVDLQWNRALVFDNVELGKE